MHLSYYSWQDSEGEDKVGRLIREEEIIAMATLSFDKVAEGIFASMSKAERAKLQMVLINKTRKAAVIATCAVVKARVGLSADLCEPIGDRIVTIISTNIRKRMAK